MSKTYNVLFICTSNSARSQMAEALLNHMEQPRFKAYSAGSHPGTAINPLALSALEHAGVNTAGLQCKNWDVFAVADAPVMDFVFTLCDSASAEVCPVWPGQPIRAHWGITPPGTGLEGEAERKAFSDTLLLLKRRLDLFTALPVDKLDQLALKLQIDEIAQNN